MASDHTELVVWQLASDLRVETLKLTRKPAFASDPRLRSETEAAVSSICRNIPEGFRRRSNREFARFLEYSYGSSGELKSLLEDAQLKNHVTPDELAAARGLRYRLDRALIGLMRHLRKSTE
jgi:four helix bundle protein